MRNKPEVILLKVLDRPTVIQLIDCAYCVASNKFFFRYSLEFLGSLLLFSSWKAASKFSVAQFEEPDNHIPQAFYSAN
ncbi:MAG: hypothetical protein NVS3B3_09300 [Aquirhabdus sp.]